MNLYQFLAAKPQFFSLAIVGEPDLVIKGTHCSVDCYQLSKQADSEQWHFSPEWIPIGRTFSSDTDEEWIGNRISYMPDVDFFINFTSLDQVWNWVCHRDSAINLALFFGAEEEPLYLKELLKKKQIDQFSYNYSVAEAKIYKNLWKLIKADESNIQTILSKNWGFPFDSSRALLVEIVREILENEFLNCLKRRYIYNASHIKEIAKLKRKVHQAKASNIEIDKLQNLIDQNVPFATWLNRLLTSAEILSNKNSLIKEYLENYREGLYALTKLQIQRDCDPNFRHHRIPSHTWKQGQYHQGVLSWKS
ncbi:MAG: hypothetical protein KME16_13360 [Scytolyngbya sp. HA4215-MV1]|nr:hypothetical protein [Scytolyngbya sp. HA4215-MV1]